MNSKIETYDFVQSYAIFFIFQVTLNSVMVWLNSDDIPHHILKCRTTMITVKNAPSEFGNIFDLAHNIHIVILVLTFFSMTGHISSHRAEIIWIADNLNLPTIVSTFLKISFFLSLVISTTFLFLYKLCSAFYTTHVQYQVKILNFLVEHIADGLDQEINDKFQEEISSRLRLCVRQDQHIRRQVVNKLIRMESFC